MKCIIGHTSTAALMLAREGLVPVPASTPKLIKWFVNGLFAIFDISDATGLSTLTDDNIEEYIKIKGITIYKSNFEEGGALHKERPEAIFYEVEYLPKFKDYVKEK